MSAAGAAQGDFQNMRMDRRRALALFGAGSLATGGSAAAQGVDQVRFDHGVASGDPTADRVIQKVLAVC